MPRKKSDLSRLSRNARSARKMRSQETEEKRAHRLALRRQYRATVVERNAWLNSLEMFTHLEDVTVTDDMRQTKNPDNTESTIETTQSSPSESKFLSEIQIEVKREPFEQEMDELVDDEVNKQTAFKNSEFTHMK